MDFGFLRASSSDYLPSNPHLHPIPNLETDRVVESFDGYTAYLLIVDEASRMIWVFLRKSKDPPIDLVSHFLQMYGRSSGGVVRCDQRGELARSSLFRTTLMEKHLYTVEPTGADSPSQNGAAEKWNDTLAVTVRALLYGAALPPKYWSATLLHAVYLHNRRVHRSMKSTPFECWYGRKPDLRRLRVFGSRVSVKRTGKRRAKLDRHDFTGIFIGYTATDANIRYIDTTTGNVKTSHHAVFDECWYHQPWRPPAAQALFDLGLAVASAPTHSTTTMVHDTVFPHESDGDDAPSDTLNTAHDGDTFTTTASSLQAHSPSFPLSTGDPNPDALAVATYGIHSKDLHQVYFSPHCFGHAVVATFDYMGSPTTLHPTAGLVLTETDGQVFLNTISPGTPCAKIPHWKKRLRGARLLQVNDTVISSTQDVVTIFSLLPHKTRGTCELLFSTPELRDGLTAEGIPQISLDQLNPRHFFQIPSPFSSPSIHKSWDGGVLHYISRSHKLTRGVLLKQSDWDEWQHSEFLQLDQYEIQHMFGEPVPLTNGSAVFNLVWTYAVKEVDGRKKARCTCDGSTRGGQVRVLDYTYANSPDHTCSRLFYALSAAENLLIFGADVSNAFVEAPPPKQGFFIHPDAAFHTWWTIHKGRPPIPPGHVIPVLSAMQGHPEAPRLWEKHADSILRKIGLNPTTHEPCLYSGSINNTRVLLLRQVDDFSVAAPDESTT